MYPQRWIQNLQIPGVYIRFTLVEPKQPFNAVCFINSQSITFLQTFLTYSSHILAITSNLRCFKSFICVSLLIRRPRNASPERHLKTMAACIPRMDTVHTRNLNKMSLLLQSDLSCRNTKQTVGAIYTRTNFVTLKYVTDGWGTESNGFKLVITAFKDKSKYANNRYLFYHVHLLRCHASLRFAYFSNTVRTPLFRINWDGEPSG